MKKKQLISAVLAVLICVPLGLNGKETAIQCANLIYGGTHTSRCFSDEFLSEVQKQTTIATERRFKSVKLSSDELSKFPFAMMTGESDFHFSKKERETLKEYLEGGGFLLASAGCSSGEFDKAFRREVKAAFPEKTLTKIKMDHTIYKTVYDIEKIETKGYGSSSSTQLEGIEIDGKLAVVYSPQGLNDTSSTEGCCCCGGNEIRNAMQVNMNIIVYALMH